MAEQQPDLSFLDDMERLDERDKEIITAVAKGEPIPGDDSGELGMYFAAIGADVTTEEGVKKVMEAKAERDEGGKPAAAEQEKRFTQAELESILAERLERKDRKAAEEREKAEAQARQKALEENEQFKELAEERANRIAELEAEMNELSGVKEKAEKYEGSLKERVEAEMANVPEHIKSLLADRDPVDQLTWLTQNREQITPARPVGSRPSPQPASDRAAEVKQDRDVAVTERQRIGAKL